MALPHPASPSPARVARHSAYCFFQPTSRAYRCAGFCFLRITPATFSQLDQSLRAVSSSLLILFLFRLAAPNSASVVWLSRVSFFFLFQPSLPATPHTYAHHHKQTTHAHTHTPRSHPTFASRHSLARPPRLLLRWHSLTPSPAPSPLPSARRWPVGHSAGRQTLVPSLPLHRHRRRAVWQGSERVSERRGGVRGWMRFESCRGGGHTLAQHVVEHVKPRLD